MKKISIMYSKLIIKIYYFKPEVLKCKYIQLTTYRYNIGFILEINYPSLTNIIF